MGGGSSFKGRCLLSWLESPADSVFMDSMVAITILDALVFSFSIVLYFLRDFDKGGYLLRLRIVVVGIVAT